MSALSTQYIGFSDNAPFDDVRVRRALAHGLDRAPLVAGTENDPAHGGFLPPAMPGHSHDLAPVYDIDRAKSLLAEAGYPDGRGLPELRLIQADPGFGPDFRRDTEAKWESQWRELGVRIRQEWVGFDELPAEVEVGPSFWNWGWVSDYPDPDGMLGTFLASMPVTRGRRAVDAARSRLARCAPATSVSSSIARPTAGSLPNRCGWCRRSTTIGLSYTDRMSRGCGRIRWASARSTR